MLAFIREIICCCSPLQRKEDALDEHARLLQFQIPTTPSEPVQPQQVEFRQRMGMIVRTTERKMVDISSRLPFNLHNRIIHDSLGSGSRSGSLEYGRDDFYEHNNSNYGSYGFSGSYQRTSQRPTHEETRTSDHHLMLRASSPSENLHSEFTGDEPSRPAAALNIRLVGITDNERGRTRQRTVTPTGLGSGGTILPKGESKITHVTLEEDPTSCTKAPQHFKLDIDPNELILSSWNE